MITAILGLLGKGKVIGISVVLITVVAGSVYFTRLVSENSRLKSDNDSLTYQHQVLMSSLADQKKKYLEAETRRSEYANKVVEIEREASTFRDCVAAGKCGVRVKTSCPTLPKSPSDPVRTDTGTSELDSVTGLNLLNLREGIKKLESRYALCQSELKARSK